GAAVVGWDLLGPHEGRVVRDCPASGHMWVGRGTTPFIVMLQHVRDSLWYIVEKRHLIEHAVHPALCAGSVIAEDVEDECVVGFARFSDGIEQAADLVVAIFPKSGKHLHLVSKQLFLVRSELVPIFDGLRFTGQLCAWRHDTHCDLTSQCLFAHLVPALIESALLLFDPFFRDMMRRMG